LLLGQSALDAQRKEKERLERLERQKQSLGENGHIEQVRKRSRWMYSEKDRADHVKMEKQHKIEKERMRKRRNSHELEKIELTQTGRLLVNAGYTVHVSISEKYLEFLKSLSEFDTSPGFGCILAHSMGLGKTIQVITFIEVFLRVTQAKRVLVIVPINTIQNWYYEFEKWLPRYSETGEICRQFEVFLLGDAVKTFDQRVNLIEDWSRKGGVLLIGYEMFRLLIRSTQPKKPAKPKPNSFNPDRSEKIDDFDKGFTADGRVKKEANEIIRSALINPGADLVVCDEGHKIKNLNTDIAVALGAIKTRRRIVLTGYPLQNNLMEYYCMVDFVRPDFLGSRKTFSIQFEKPIKNGQCIDSTARDVKIARQRIHVLNSMLKGFIQRRTHHLLKAILPESKEFVLLLRKSPLQHALYRNFVMYANSEISSGNTSVFNPLKAFAACSKIWNHPDILAKTLERKREERRKAMQQKDVRFVLLLFPMTCQDPKQGDESSRTSSKARRSNRLKTGTIRGVLEEEFDLTEIDQGLQYDWAEIAMASYKTGNIENGYKMVLAMELLDACVKIGEKMLIFSQNLTALDLIESYLSRRPLKTPTETTSWMRSINYFRLDGATPGSEREKLINRFNSDPSVYLFLISTRAGSLGINLVSANRCIIFDACWNPCHDAQAVCRVYRLYGQQRRTFIYRLILNNCMEKAIFNRQISKHGLQQRVVDEAQVDANITQKELETLLMYDESLDVIHEKWDTTRWDFGDEVLESVVKNRSEMLAEEPFLHESLMLEREEGLSEEEKKEAELWFTREQYKDVRVTLIFPSHIVPWFFLSAFNDTILDSFINSSNFGSLVGPNRMFNPMEGPRRVPPFPGAAIAFEPASNSRGSVQLIRTDRVLSLPVVSHPSERREIPANTQAMLVLPNRVPPLVTIPPDPPRPLRLPPALNPVPDIIELD
uniref:Helicase ATP-binding domain-containing protein n=1 Tax=Haemonchus placei TaxID=6290 RepID=A0A0N4WUL8_HAEPC